MAATSNANSAKIEYNLAASEKRDAMAPPTEYGFDNSAVSAPRKWFPALAFGVGKVC
jgi:hypothetical protein